MTFMDAMEIVISMAEDNVLDENDPEVQRTPAMLEAAKAQKQAIQKVRTFHDEAVAKLVSLAGLKAES